MTILLKDGTVGKLVLREGDMVTVFLCDENGNPIEVEGEVDCILEEDE